MKNRIIIGIVSLFVVVIFWSLIRPALLSKTGEIKMDHSEHNSQIESSYWTCPMHPEIHSDKPGVCPICHMRLVQVKAQGPAANAHAAHKDKALTEKRATIQISDEQMKMIGIQKIDVEKMDLIARIPVAGRFISSNSVAFQIYEMDLKYIKSGLSFKGFSGQDAQVEIEGVISSVDSIVDPTSRTVRVVGNVKSGPRNALSETTFRGDVAIELKNIIAIPENSVLHTGDGDLVYLVQEDHSLIAKQVRLGMKTERYFQVLDGLSIGQQISSGPNFLIDSEAKIRGVGNSGHTNH